MASVKQYGLIEFIAFARMLSELLWLHFYMYNLASAIIGFYFCCNLKTYGKN